MVEFGVFGGAPLFRPEVPKPFKNRYLGDLRAAKIGARPENAKSYHDGSDPPFAGPLRGRQIESPKQIYGIRPSHSQPFGCFGRFFSLIKIFWQAPDAPSKRTTKKCTISKRTLLSSFQRSKESHSSSDLVWVVGAAAACWGGSARDLWKEVKRVRFDGAFLSGTFSWCIRGLHYVTAKLAQ